jgi:hypothetical protein
VGPRAVRTLRRREESLVSTENRNPIFRSPRLQHSHYSDRATPVFLKLDAFNVEENHSLAMIAQYRQYRRLQYHLPRVRVTSASSGHAVFGSAGRQTFSLQFIAIKARVQIFAGNGTAAPHSWRHFARCAVSSQRTEGETSSQQFDLLPSLPFFSFSSS